MTITTELRGNVVTLVPMDDTQDAQEVADLFNTRPDWVVASRDAGFPDEVYGLADAEQFLWQHLAVDDGYLLRVEQDGVLRGIVAGLSRAPSDGAAWIGLLFVDATADLDAVVPDVLRLVEEHFTAAGAGELKMAVLDDWPLMRPYLAAARFTEQGSAGTTTAAACTSTASGSSSPTTPRRPVVAGRRSQGANVPNAAWRGSASPTVGAVTVSRAALVIVVLATACSGGGTPTAAPTSPAPATTEVATPSPTVSRTPSRTPTPRVTATPRPTPTATRTVTRTPRPTPTRTRTRSPRPTRTPEPPTPTFEGIRRGSSQGPDYHAVLVGMNYGGDGGYNVWANCRPGTVRVTVHEDGLNSGRTPLRVSVNDKTMIYDGYARDGLVVTARVTDRVRVMTGWPGEKQFKIEYDCRNR